MYLKSLEFINFRNLEEDKIYPNREVNVIFGDNAQGKTNLLEGVWLFTGGHSFRGNKDSELVRLENGKNLSSARLTAEFFSGDREQNAVLMINSGRRSSIINGVEKKTGSALVGKICAVIFSPEHLLLIKEGPQKRRNFIDGAICQIKPSYVRSMSRYLRALNQRNTLLKDMFHHPELMETMDIWDDRLITFGSELIRERLKYVDKLIPEAGKIYRGISRESEKLEIKYQWLGDDREDIEAHYRKALKKAEKTDIKLGFTSVGPHRDDLELSLDGFSARTYGSQGQQRSIVLALKLAEAKLLEDSIGEAPLILLDDVMSELDESRQDYLLNNLTGRQIFISCCSPETVNLLKNGGMFKVNKGKVTQLDIKEQKPRKQGKKS